MMQTEVLNISPVIVWVVALSQMLTFGLTIWGLMASGGRANAKRLDDHAVRLDYQHNRIFVVEQAVGAVPTKEGMLSVALAISEIRGDLKAMSAEMAGTIAIMSRLEAIVSRHDNHLLKG